MFNQKYWVFYDALYRSFTFGLASFFIIIGIVKFEHDKMINMHRAFLMLGEASYSLYLLHLPVVVASAKILSLANIRDAILIHIVMFVVIGLTCLVSVYFYKWIEKPLIDKMNLFFVKK